MLKEPRSVENVLPLLGYAEKRVQFLGFAEKHQDHSAVPGLCELLSSAKMQSIEEWASPKSVENVLQSVGFANSDRR
jgi:hypothetical protein